MTKYISNINGNNDFAIDVSLESPPEMITRLLEIINSGIVVSDLGQNILFLNKKAASIFDYNRSILAGERLETLFMDEDRDIFLPNIIHMVRTYGEYEGEAMMKKADGTGFITLLSASMMPVNSRNNIVFTINDISRLKGIERALQRSKRMMYLGSILDDISHQIRNPVLAIGGFARRLMNTGVKHPEYTKIILEEAARLELLVTTLTEFTHLPKPKFRIITMAQLAEVIAECIEKESAAGDMQIRMIMNVESVCSPLIDLKLFKIAFEHVLLNACEAVVDNDKGSAQVTVEITSPMSEGMACAVKITDNGEGIREKVFPRIFHPFFTTKTGHIGMGLTFTKQILEELGGDVSIESDFTDGTVVALELAGDRRRRIRCMLEGR